MGTTPTSTQAAAGIGRRPADVPTRVFDWGTIKWLVTPNLDEGIGITTGEVIIYPGQGHAPHRHPGEEEVIYVISGEGLQTVGDGEAYPIREGDAVYIPRDALHSTYNTGWSPLRLVVVYTPGGAETGLDSLPDARILEPGEAPKWAQAN
jgi:oxalate decarboxylase/phosphoglucose isomerase-like protein (cupin superfamily)